MRKYRLFGKINVFDLILVLVCIAVVYVAFIFAAPGQDLDQSGQRVRFTVEFVESKEGFHQQIVPGPIVVDAIRDVVVGHVVYAYGLPMLRDSIDYDYNIVRRTEVEGFEFTYVVIETFANVTEFDTEVNGFRIAVNRGVYIRSRDFAGGGFITNVEFMD